MQPAVSVIIPTYNRAHLVGRAIQSVLNQTMQDFELIVIDNASSDNTEEIVKSFQDNRIQYIQHEINKGISASRNTGIRSSSGKYIAFLDSDDEWLPEKLEKQLNVFRDASPSLGALYTGLIAIDKDNQVISHPRYRGNIFYTLLIKNWIGISTTLVKKDCFEKTGFFDEDLLLQGCEDWDIFIRLAQFYEFDFITEALVKYYSHEEPSLKKSGCIKNISSKYDKYIKSSPKEIRAAHYLHIGRGLWWSGNITGGTKFFINSFTAHPSSIASIVHFILLYFRSKFVDMLKGHLKISRPYSLL